MTASFNPFRTSSKCPFCGWDGFATEALANQFANMKRATGQKMTVTQCPLGAGRWHTTDENIKPIDAYRAMLMSGPPRPKPAEPASPPPSKGTYFGGLEVAVPDDEEISTDAANASQDRKSKSHRRCIKIGYGSEQLAERMLKIAQAAGRDEKRSYHCDKCSKWHLTSLEQERNPDDLVHEELVTLPVRGGGFMTVSASRWPDGSFAGVTLTMGERYHVRLQPEHVPVVHAILGEYAQAPAPKEEDDP